MKTSNRKLCNKVNVGVEATEVGGQEEFGCILDKFGVGGPILRSIRSSFIEDENWLVDLDPFDARSFEFRKELLVDGDEFGKEGDGFEVWKGLSSSLCEEKVREGTKNDGPGLDSKSLCLLVLGEGLIIEELKIGFLRELGYDVVVVRVKPVRSRSESPEAGRKVDRPLLHLRCGHINTISLATTTHSEEHVKIRDAEALVARGDGVKGRGVIEDMVVEGELATGQRGGFISYLG